MATPAFFITGITGGIGSALAARLLARGWRVGGCARTEADLTSLTARLPGLHCQVADVRDPAALDAALGGFTAEAGGLDGLAHSVGSILLKPAHLTSPEEFRATFEINTVSAFLALRAAIPLLTARGGGSVVLFSSVAAQVGLQNHEAIAAAKGAVEGLTRAAAASYAQRMIRVNCIAPGLVETRMAAGLLASEPARQASEKLHPIGRIGRPDDVAAAAELLLDPASTWITGQCWSVDGGLADVRVRR